MAIEQPQNVRYCTCVECKGNMILVWDADAGRYLAACEKCKTLTELPETPQWKT